MAYKGAILHVVVSLLRLTASIMLLCGYVYSIVTISSVCIIPADGMDVLLMAPLRGLHVYIRFVPISVAASERML